jgi:hypothetical protein
VQAVNNIASWHRVSLVDVKKRLIMRWLNNAVEGVAGGSDAHRSSKESDAAPHPPAFSLSSFTDLTASWSTASSAPSDGPSVFAATEEEVQAAECERNELRIAFVLACGRDDGGGAVVSDVSPEEGARALLTIAMNEKSGFALRARAISCVFRLLPAAVIDELHPYVWC